MIIQYYRRPGPTAHLDLEVRNSTARELKADIKSDSGRLALLFLRI